MENEFKTAPLHVVDLAFALFASEYIEHDGLREGTSFEELEFAGTSRDSSILEVSDVPRKSSPGQGTARPRD